jgi:hypothetical protein
VVPQSPKSTLQWLAALVPKPLSVALRLRYKPVSCHFRYGLVCKRVEDIGPGKFVMYMSEVAQEITLGKILNSNCRNSMFTLDLRRSHDAGSKPLSTTLRVQGGDI